MHCTYIIQVFTFTDTPRIISIHMDRLKLFTYNIQCVLKEVKKHELASDCGIDLGAQLLEQLRHLAINEPLAGGLRVRQFGAQVLLEPGPNTLL